MINNVALDAFPVKIALHATFNYIEIQIKCIMVKEKKRKRWLLDSVAVCAHRTGIGEYYNFIYLYRGL